MKFHYSDTSIDIPDSMIPERANWVAGNSLGSICWFERKPIAGVAMWLRGGDWGYLDIRMMLDECPDWQTTLVKIERGEHGGEDVPAWLRGAPVADTPPKQPDINGMHGYCPGPGVKLGDGIAWPWAEEIRRRQEAGASLREYDGQIRSAGRVGGKTAAFELVQAQARILELEEEAQELRRQVERLESERFCYRNAAQCSRLRGDRYRRIAEHYRAKYLGLKAGGRIHRAWQREAREPEPVLTFPRYKDAAGREL